MPRQAFKMFLHPGQEEEYMRRHDALWPELHELLKTAGISNYSIFLDRETHVLFGVMDVADEAAKAALPDHPIMQRWWAFMKDIMDTHADNSPVSVEMKEVFFMK